MVYENILDILIKKFPSLGKELDPDFQELPHCVFDMVFTPYIIQLCQTKNGVELQEVGNFLELLAQCPDIRVRELLNVSILEPLVLDQSNSILTLLQFLGPKALSDLKYWCKRYAAHGDGSSVSSDSPSPTVD